MWVDVNMEVKIPIFYDSGFEFIRHDDSSGKWKRHFRLLGFRFSSRSPKGVNDLRSEIVYKMTFYLVFYINFVIYINTVPMPL